MGIIVCQNFITNDSCSAQIGVLRRVLEMLINGNSLRGEVLSSRLSNHIETEIVVVLHEFFCHFQYIMVVSTSQSLIRCHHDIATASVRIPVILLLTFGEVFVVQIRHMTEHPGNHCLHAEKEWLGIL